MINRLLYRLNRIFNREPKAVPALLVQARQAATVTVAEGQVVLATVSRTTAIDIADKTIQQLATAINAVPSFTATVNNPILAGTLAKAIVPFAATDAASATMHVPTSVFYQEMLVYSWVMSDQWDNYNDATRQLYFHTATGSWLDYWCLDHLGNKRKPEDASDKAYRDRVIAEISRLTQNNKSLELLLAKALDKLDFSVDDEPAMTVSGREYHGDFSVNIEVDINKYVPDNIDAATPNIISIANKSKAAGTRLKVIRARYKTQNPLYFAAATVAIETVAVSPWYTGTLEGAAPINMLAAISSFDITEIRPQ